MNTVINLNHFQTLAEIDTTYPDWRYLGRSGTRWELAPSGERVPAPLTGSALANPFKITRDGNREQVIQKYRLWLWQRMRQGDDTVMRELAAIGPNTALACWCAPRHCHGHVVAQAHRVAAPAGRRAVCRRQGGSRRLGPQAQAAFAHALAVHPVPGRQPPHVPLPPGRATAHVPAAPHRHRAGTPAGQWEVVRHASKAA